MTAYRDVLAYHIGDIVCSLALMLFVFQLITLFRAVRHKRRAAFVVVPAVECAIGFAFLYLLLDGIYQAHYTGGRTSYPAVVNALYDLPATAVIGIEVLLVLLTYLTLRSINRYEKSHISGGAIKETLDLLPVAVCFGDRNGEVHLSNVKMNEYCRKVTNGNLYNTNELWRIICEKGEAHGAQMLVVTDDNTALMFAKTDIQANGNLYTQITAVDFTEPYKITAELKANEKKLRDIQYRMRLMSSEQNSLVMNREILKARTTLHDEVGYVLLRSRYYFENPDEADEASIAELLTITNALLLGEAEKVDDAQTDIIDYTVKLANGIGVEVVINGAPPESAKELLALAIRECAANTVKHAEGDLLTVDVATENGKTQICLTNNGKPPMGEITETGGLLSLRKTAEAQGAKMCVKSMPEFKLTLEK